MSKMDELFDETFEKAMQVMELSDKKKKAFVPYPRVEKEQCAFHTLNEYEQTFARSIIETPDFKSTAHQMGEIIQQSEFAAEAIQEIEGKEIDLIKVMNVCLSDWAGLRGLHYQLSVTKR
jgi:hypothetical protein